MLKIFIIPLNREMICSIKYLSGDGSTLRFPNPDYTNLIQAALAATPLADA